MYLPKEVFLATPSGWVGAKIGLFGANFINGMSAGHVDFDWIRIEEA